MTSPTTNDAPLDAIASDAKEPILYTIEEAARLLRLSRTTLYELMWSDELVPFRIGRRIRFTRAELERFVAEAPRRRR